MHGDELLLLTDGVEEAERVRAETHDAECPEREQAENASADDPSSLAPAPRRQYEEYER